MNSHWVSLGASCLGATVCLGLASPSIVQAATVTNGGFNDSLAGWTVVNEPGSSGSWFHTSGGSATLSGHPLLTPSEGTGFAHTSQTGPTSQVLFQDINLEAGMSHLLSFDWFAQNWAGGEQGLIDAGTASHVQNSNQHLRVDLLEAGFDDWFSSDSSNGVLANILAPVAEDAPVSDWNTLSDFDLSAWAGQSVRLAFRQVDNQGFFNAGVDNVDIESEAVPEPSALVAFLGLVGLGFGIKRQAKG